jgi:hypothetical protein
MAPKAALMQKREVWLPTPWGWLVILAIAVAGIAGLGAAAVLSLYSFLAIDEPSGASVAVVEGWMSPEELDEVIRLVRARGNYGRIVTTGGPIHAWTHPAPQATFAHRAATYLRTHGLGGLQISEAPSPITEQNRTFNSALMVGEWAERTGLKLAAIDVISRGPHARRSRLLFRQALGPQVDVGILAVRPHGYDPAAWWRNTSGARDVLEQAAGLVWVAIFFDPSRAGATG